MWFLDAPSEALGTLNPAMVKAQIGEFVPSKTQKALAAAGLRDEHVFPLPIVLEAKPSLVGYYRLLLGASQKAFYTERHKWAVAALAERRYNLCRSVYKGSTHLSVFKSMEETGTVNQKQAAKLPDFCRAMAIPLTNLVTQIPTLSERDLRELPLLTFGAQLQGSNNTQIGKKAMQEAFATIKSIVANFVVKSEPDRLTLKNSSGRAVFIDLAHDSKQSLDLAKRNGLTLPRCWFARVKIGKHFKRA